MENQALILTTGSVVLTLLGAAMLLALYRLIKGPSLADRVVALDLIAALTVGTCGVYAIVSGQAAFLRPAIALALVSFLGSIAFVYYINKGGTA